MTDICGLYSMGFTTHTHTHIVFVHWYGTAKCFESIYPNIDNKRNKNTAWFYDTDNTKETNNKKSINFYSLRRYFRMNRDYVPIRGGGVSFIGLAHNGKCLHSMNISKRTQVDYFPAAYHTIFASLNPYYRTICRIRHNVFALSFVSIIRCGSTVIWRVCRCFCLFAMSHAAVDLPLNQFRLCRTVLIHLNVKIRHCAFKSSTNTQ